MKKILLQLLFIFVYTNLIAQSPEVQSLILVNASTNEDILELTSGFNINLKDYEGIAFNIRANGSIVTKSIGFQLSGSLSHSSTENVAPFALYGDFPAGNYRGQEFPVGSYNITATPYSENGVIGQDYTINFNVVNEPVQRSFITTWKTDNIGTSNDNQITIPTYLGETYNYKVNWGDGSSNSGITGNITHTYATSGTYRVSISGDFPRIYFNNTEVNEIVGDENKLLSIDQWGEISWTSMDSAFAGCKELMVKATDEPILSNLQSLRRMFFNVDSSPLTIPGIENWDISTVSDLSGMFNNTTFNQDLSGWDVSNTADMTNIFAGVTLSSQIYDSILLGWSNQNLQHGVTFNGGESQFCQGEAARQLFVSFYNWSITDGGKSESCKECPTEKLVLNTQAQIDDFATIHDAVNCRFASGILIEGSEITNLDGLNSLTRLGGEIEIKNTKITNLDGLSALTDASKIVLSNNSNLSDVNGLSLLGSGFNGSIGNIIIENNASLTNLNGFSSLTSIQDDLIIKNNASLTNLDGLSSIQYIDNFLNITSNPALENIDGLSNVSYVGLGFDIKSNTVLSNLNGLSLVAETFGNVKIIDNTNLTDITGISNIDKIWGDLVIVDNGKLSNCAIEAVCKAESIVNGSVSISGNTGNCLDYGTALTFCGSSMDFEADLLTATYLEGSSNPSPKGQILRVEEGNRETYLKFDLSELNGAITKVRLEMVVSEDPGQGTVDVFLGNHSNWTETGLTGSNKPIATGDALASVNGTFALGQTVVWVLSSEMLPVDGHLTLIVKHRNGNDVAFASDETAKAPKLMITTNGITEPSLPFITVWKTDNPGFSNDNQIKVSTFAGETYNYNVDWGDGNSDTNVIGDITHTYSVEGTYTVSIGGVFPRMIMDGYADAEKLLQIQQWGDIKWSSMEYAFAGCKNLKVVAYDAPNLSRVSSMAGMFRDCDSITGSIFNDWDVSNVTNMSELFAFSNFNSSEIYTWDVSNVTNMREMFRGTDFNQDIGDWDVSKVKFMDQMFGGNTSFNQDISSWDVGNVESMAGMFTFARSFNQNISQWDVSKVTSMGAMFQAADSFNQDISGWDVDNVTHMDFMLNGAINFNQDIGNWKVNNVVDMEHMLSRTNLSIANYDSLLQGWSGQNLQNGVTFNAGNSQYCIGKDARLKLIGDFGWIISDGGLAPDCNIPPENDANLIAATYIEGMDNPQPLGPILRVEKGKRETYLKFDTKDFTGVITHARLEMYVTSDPGYGTIEVFLGNTSNWTETGLDGSNKPVAVNNALASISGIHALGQTKIWNLDVTNLSTGGELTLIVKQSNGNDVAFASDESLKFPRLSITTNAGSTSKLTSTLKLSPNPAADIVQVSFKSDTGKKIVNNLMIYDVYGRVVLSVPSNNADTDGTFHINVSMLSNGIYFLKTLDENGLQYQKQLAIKH